MNLIFVNTLEKRTGENRFRTAQISIQEEKGNWNVVWSEPSEDGNLQHQEWFAGNEWAAMLNVFRAGIRSKLEEGFCPLIPGTDGKEKGRLLPFQSRRVQLLSYYSEAGYQEEVFEQLKQWRRDRSREEGKSAYIVASNRMLHMLATFLPRTREELMELPGMGENRLRAYGEGILAITSAYERNTSFPLDWVEKSVDPESFDRWRDDQERLRLEHEQEKKEARVRLLQAIAEGDNLADLPKKLSMNRREIVQAVEELDKEGYAVGLWVDKELQNVEPVELQLADRWFQELGDRYLKPVVEKMYSEEERKGKDLERIYEWLRLYRLHFRKQAM